ncbi:glycosyltransferase [Phreatobacter stygius]|uniref:Glycosyltransferase family 4 protein n=1 Tax=Phreatobacter stygius TaxID=1940610 RepID=A0A4D7AVI8_9HYPH|nr:glycosyltransferase [Phreatobacter stygius]QCI64979.1 glycosyltransferase family 4 protein [Phreatobacter stygius]
MRDASLPREPGLEGRTVLQVLPALDGGREPRLVLAIAAALTRAGARALVAAEKGPLIGELQAAGGEWIPLDARTRNPVGLMRNAATLSGLIGREAVDLIHVHASGPAWSAHSAARLARRPLITSFHASPDASPRLPTLARWALGRGDAVLVPSAYLAARVGAIHGVERARLAVVSPGLDLAGFDPARVPREANVSFRLAAGLTGAGRMVLHQARLDPAKGQMVLVDAVRLLVNGGLTDTVFVIACEGPERAGYRAQLARRIQAQGLDDIVRLVGPEDCGPGALVSAHLAVVASIQPESIGRNAIEAIAMGLPAIVSDDGALPEVVPAPPAASESERVGFRVSSGDALALAEGIGAGLSLEPGAHDAIGRRGRVHARRFSLERMQEDVLGVYRRLLIVGRRAKIAANH